MEHHRYRRALITGASSGIGAAFAAEMPADCGLLLAGRDPERLAKVAARHARDGREVQTVVCDLTAADGIEALVAAADAFAIDLLINNAGVGAVGPVLDQPVETALATVQLNCLAVVALTRRLLPGMLARARGDGGRAGLIVVASAAAFAPVPYFAVYAASKAFDLHFAEALAEELRGEPVDVLALCPGATRTEFGARSGAGVANVPGAADPRQVAAGALAALGRRRVHLTGPVTQLALGPSLLPRRLLTGALGCVARAFAPAATASGTAGRAAGAR